MESDKVLGSFVNMYHENSMTTFSFYLGTFGKWDLEGLPAKKGEKYLWSNSNNTKQK